MRSSPLLLGPRYVNLPSGERSARYAALDPTLAFLAAAASSLPAFAALAAAAFASASALARAVFSSSSREAPGTLVGAVKSSAEMCVVCAAWPGSMAKSCCSLFCPVTFARAVSRTIAWIESDWTKVPAMERMGSSAHKSSLSRREVSCRIEVMVKRMFPKTLDCSRALASSAYVPASPNKSTGVPAVPAWEGYPISSSMGGTIRVIEVSLALEVHR